MKILKKILLLTVFLSMPILAQSSDDLQQAARSGELEKVQKLIEKVN